MDIQQIKWFEPQTLCLAQGAAVAQNLMFESKADHSLFLSLWERYLGNMAKLVQYHLSPTGWILLFKTYDSDSIKKAYLKQRYKSNKANKANTLEQPKRMLSEHFRIFLSRYVLESNQRINRQGTKVKSRFLKFIVNKAQNYIALFNQMKIKLKALEQKSKRYNPDISRYDAEKEMAQNHSIWKTANWLYEKHVNRHPFVDNFLLVNTNSFVLQKKYDNNSIHKFHPPPS